MKHFLILCDVVFGVVMTMVVGGLMSFGIMVFWSLFTSASLPIQIVFIVFLVIATLLFFFKAKEKREECVDEQKSE